jgi:hypothetical protein
MGEGKMNHDIGRDRGRSQFLLRLSLSLSLSFTTYHNCWNHSFFQLHCYYYLLPLNMDTAVKRFFSSPRFAVAGASNDPAKFGYKRNCPQPNS